METQEILLIKNGELALKGLNRGTFEDILMKNIRRRLRGAGEFSLRKAQSTLYIEPKDDAADLEEACERISRVFGISAFSRALRVEKEMAAILASAGDYLREQLEGAHTFKVDARRSDKAFPLTSPQICAAVGERLLNQFPHLRVDVHRPERLVMVEIRDFGAYIHAAQLPGAGGMPVGTGGRAALLISGGIDSPVAGYMMAKRGIELTAVHFASPPYTSERAEEKVVSLLREVAGYAGSIEMRTVPFTHIQEDIRRHCPEELFTILMRRYMMRIASQVARQENCAALITGESVGQVASQTLPALACTEDAASLPVLRPLIGMDKEEIIVISRRIGTFDISIQPYEDCCTVFTPRHPRTRPRMEQVVEAEQALDGDALIAEAMSGIRRRTVG
ncbi:MAG: tRNA 4-thiouridine(8) synthase ThiI [Clostridiales bacterium]|nr:tRNA 4-thiouridine(8) synthase ThiI [Clostridiales bacterium]